MWNLNITHSNTHTLGEKSYMEKSNNPDLQSQEIIEQGHRIGIVMLSGIFPWCYSFLQPIMERRTFVFPLGLFPLHSSSDIALSAVGNILFHIVLMVTNFNDYFATEFKGFDI